MGPEAGVPTNDLMSPLPARRKMYALVIVAVVVLASVVVAAYVVDRLERGVVFTVHTDKEQYSLGDMIYIHVEYTNYGFDTVDLTFCSSLVASFSVHDSNGSFVCSIPQIALMWLVYETLGPGETLTGGCYWEQVDDMDEQVLSPGSYTLLAEDSCREFEFSARTTISIAA